MNSRVWLFVPCLLCCGVASCGAPATLPHLGAPDSGKTMDYATVAARAGEASALVGAQNEFGARLLTDLEGRNKEHRNLLASPTSLWQALTLTATGARGATKAQMSGLLSLQKLPDAQIGAQNRAFNALLSAQKGATISVANSLWLADTFTPTPAFVAGAKADFGAGVEQFAAANPADGAARINAWVGAHTKKEITHIVERGDVEGKSALLVNAVYFKGGWKDVFDKTQTKPAPFHLANGGMVRLPTMNAHREHAYLAGGSFEGARLAYGNTSCALWVLLPKAGKTPADVIRELEAQKSRQLNANGTVILSLPRFDVQWRADVAPDLAKIAPLPFDPKADFSAMGQPAFGIAEVLHVCKMRVDEEGTVAAAATVVGMAGAAMMKPEPPKVLKFDRPFVVALVEESSGARLFEGAIYNPGASG